MTSISSLEIVIRLKPEKKKQKHQLGNSISESLLKAGRRCAAEREL